MSNFAIDVFSVIFEIRSATVASSARLIVEAPPGARNLVRMIAVVLDSVGC